MIRPLPIARVLLVAVVAFGEPAWASQWGLSYSGRLTGAGGAPVQGAVELKVKFFDAATEGNQLGADVDTANVVLADGVFQVPLALDGAGWQAVLGGPDHQVWVEVTDVTHTKVYPRQSFNAVPYALRVPVDGATITYNNNGLLTVPQPAAVATAGATQSGYLANGDWVQFNGAPQKSYVDGLNASQVANVAALSTNLTTTTTNLTALTSAALKKDGSVPLTNPWNVGGQDVTNAGNLLMSGSKVFGLSVATSDPGGLGAGDTGKIWYNGGIRLWNGASAQSLGISGAGVTSLNGLNQNAQSLANGFTGTTPAWVSGGMTHTLNIPMASAGGTVTAGLISNAEWVLFNGKQNVLPAANAVTNGYLASSDWVTFNGKDPFVLAGSTTQYYRGDKSWQTLNSGGVPETTNLYFTTARAQAAVTAEPPVVAGTTSQYYRGDKSWQTLNSGGVAETTNLYFTTARAQAAVTAEAPVVAGTVSQYYRGDKSWQALNTNNVTEGANLYFTTARAQAAVTAEPPVVAGTTSQYYRGDKTWQAFPTSAGAATGYLASTDWLAFNGKQPNLGYTPVNKAGDTMTGALSLPPNGLAVGTSQLVTQGGNVGVGTTAPGALLEVHGTSNTYAKVSSTATNFDVVNWYSDGTNNVYTGILGASVGGSGIYGIYNGGTRMVVAANGNVGIGTTLPNSALDLNGAMTVRGMSAPALSGAGQAVIYYDSTANRVRVSENGGSYVGLAALDPAVAGGRLTLSSGTPVTTADVTGATSIFYTPYKSNRIALYDGANWGTYVFSEQTLVLGTLSSGFNYDIFGYISSGSLALDAPVAWTNNNLRATAIVMQDGVWSKSGATTRRYLGTIRTTSATTTEDSKAHRFVWNYNNRVKRFMMATDSTVGFWSYSSTTWRAANGHSADMVDLVYGVAEDLVQATARAEASAPSGAGAAVGVGLDRTNGNDAVLYAFSCYLIASCEEPVYAIYEGYPSVGYHAFQWVEALYGSGTVQFGSEPTNGTAGSITAEVND